MFGTVLICTFEKLVDDTFDAPPQDVIGQLFGVLKGLSRDVLVIVYPSFVAGAERFFRRIVSRDLEARMSLQGDFERWFESRVAPSLRAVGSEYRLESLGYAPTASPAAFEIFVLGLIDEYLGMLARQLQADILLRSPAQVCSGAGKAVWRPMEIRRSRAGQFRCLMAGPVTFHALVAEKRRPVSLPSSLLLLSSDYMVSGLALDAYPDARVVCLGYGTDLPEALRKAAPPDRRVEVRSWR